MDKRHFARIGLIAAAALEIAACTSTQSRVTTTYYTIRGVSGEDLDREIAAKGPLKGHALASAAISSSGRLPHLRRKRPKFFRLSSSR